MTIQERIKNKLQWPAMVAHLISYPTLVKFLWNLKAISHNGRMAILRKFFKEYKYIQYIPSSYSTASIRVINPLTNKLEWGMKFVAFATNIPGTIDNLKILIKDLKLNESYIQNLKYYS